MNCAIQCMNAQIFDWSTTLLASMTGQLTACRQRTHRNFGFGTILCSFFYERVPCFSPQRTVRGHLATFPTVCRWVALLPRQGGGRTTEVFNDDFFAWLSRQIPAIEDYPYAGIDFSRDPAIPVPPGEERGEMDVGPVRPADYAWNRRRPRPEAAAAASRGAAVAGNLPAGEAERALRRIERNFTELTRIVPMAEIEDLPPSLQTHIMGVPRTWV